METYNATDMEEAGLSYHFLQDSRSRSAWGVLRGLHFQKAHPQAKLVSVNRGRVYAVAVDLRIRSESFGRWHGELLQEHEPHQLLLPRGFAFGFLSLEELTELSYKCDEVYHPEDQGGLAWNDPTLGIRWPELTGEWIGSASAAGYRMSDGTPLLMAERDQRWPGLADAYTFPL